MVGIIFFTCYAVLVYGFIKYAESKVSSYTGIKLSRLFVSLREKRRKSEHEDLLFIRCKVKIKQIEQHMFEEELQKCREEVDAIKSRVYDGPDADTKPFVNNPRSDSDHLEAMEV